MTSSKSAWVTQEMMFKQKGRMRRATEAARINTFRPLEAEDLSKQTAEVESLRLEPAGRVR